MGHPPTPETDAEPAPLRRLRRLVTLLTLTLTLGMITITGLLAWRLTTASPAIALPSAIPLPTGETLLSYTQSPDYTVLITRDTEGQDRLHLVSPGTQTIRQTVPLN